MHLLRFTRLGLLAPVVLAVIPFAAAQHLPKESAPVSCQRFAQQFYDWYAPLTQKDTRTPVWILALKRRPELFSTVLREALMKDWALQSHADELVGIDFDPFFGSQDPADHYAVRKPVVQGSLCSVQVWRDSKTDTAAKTGKPEAIAELALDNGHLVFTDFFYPVSKESLLQILTRLRHERSDHR